MPALRSFTTFVCTTTSCDQCFRREWISSRNDVGYTNPRQITPSTRFPKDNCACYSIKKRHIPARLVASIGTLYRSEEPTSELQSLMRISYAVFCLNKKQHFALNHKL